MHFDGMRGAEGGQCRATQGVIWRAFIRPDTRTN